MASKLSLVHVVQGHSGERRRRASTGTDSPGTSGTGQKVAEHLCLKDFHKLLKLLSIKLPRNVLNADVVMKSRQLMFSRDAKTIVQMLKNGCLRIVQKPRLPCRKVSTAFKLRQNEKFCDLAKIIFFMKRKPNEKTLKEKWEKIPLKTRRHLRMKESFSGRRSAISENMRQIKTRSQKDEMRCLQYFIKKYNLSGVRYRRECPIEFEFLSGRMDFLIKTSRKKSGRSEHVMLECKSTKKKLENTHQITEGREELNPKKMENFQTRAYRYLLNKTLPENDSVRIAMVVRESQKKEDETDEDDTDEDEGEEEIVNRKKENKIDDREYKEYKDNRKELKAKFCGGYVTVSADMTQFDHLMKLCREKALPLYLAVLNQIFEKVQKKKSHRKLKKESKS